MTEKSQELTTTGTQTLHGIFIHLSNKASSIVVLEASSQSRHTIHLSIHLTPNNYRRPKRHHSIPIRPSTKDPLQLPTLPNLHLLLNSSLLNLLNHTQNNEMFISQQLSIQYTSQMAISEALALSTHSEQCSEEPNGSTLECENRQIQRL